MVEQQRLEETYAFLQEQFSENLTEALTALRQYAEQQHDTTITIPISAYQNARTPLENTVSHLQDAHALTPSAIAKLLHRRKSTINNALKSAAKKPVPKHQASVKTQRIPVTAFNNTLGIGEAIVLTLARQGLSNIHIAELLQRDPRNTHKQLQNAKKKLGVSM